MQIHFGSSIAGLSRIIDTSSSCRRLFPPHFHPLIGCKCPAFILMLSPLIPDVSFGVWNKFSQLPPKTPGSVVLQKLFPVVPWRAGLGIAAWISSCSQDPVQELEQSLRGFWVAFPILIYQVGWWILAVGPWWWWDLQQWWRVDNSWFLLFFPVPPEFPRCSRAPWRSFLLLK